MGMIAATTPGTRSSYEVQRESVAILKVAEMAQVDIVDYRFSNYARQNIKFEVLPQLQCIAPPVDILWELSMCFHQQVPNWQGMMHTIHSRIKPTPEKSSVAFLPMIDMYPGDPTCILSTLTYICKLAEKNNIPPVVTFDQPLFWKASEIIHNAQKDSPLKNIVLMLGSFHTLMNLLGAIGTLMQGTGLTTLFEEIFGENAVKYVMTGKSVQRALRGHLLLEKCLNGMIFSELMDGSDAEFTALVDACEEIYTSLMAGDTNSESILAEQKITVEQRVEEKKRLVAERSRTAKLWISYMKMVKIARMLVLADRSGSWSTHLSAIAECLPIFAAAGHFNYLKSAYLYLQSMTDLEARHPAVFKKFQEGFHVIRRTDQFWAGLGSDLVIEQTLMRSLKSTGGLTRGSGMSEEQRSLWTLSSPVCSQYNNAMQDFTRHAFITSEQHKDVTEARKKRDQSDLEKLREKLETCSPFSAGDPSLRNIITGVVAVDNVDVDNFWEVGQKVIDQLVGKPVFTHSFKRKDKAKTLGDVASVKVGKEASIDPALLFQRLVVISQSGDISFADALGYELSPFPPALFETRHVMRKPDKAQLAAAIEDYAHKKEDEPVTNDIPKTDKYVLDGGSLIQRVPWKKGMTYGSIADLYIDFTIRHYGLATVVFDGYKEVPSTKDSTHDRRKQKNCPQVHVTPDAIFNGKKDEFLSRGSNKEALIRIISARLKDKGCHVINCEGDADCQIVHAAIEASRSSTTTLVGEDTDLLVLLLYFMNPKNNSLFFRSDKTSVKKKPTVYNIGKLKLLLGQPMCSHLLFIHAFTGCDTTSRIYGIGKKSLFQSLLKGDANLEICSKHFTNPGETSDAIEQFGTRAMGLLFGGKDTDSLTSLRHAVLTKKVVSAKSFVAPERLPPTESASKYHSLRCYLQIMTWMGNDNDMDAKDWGWKCENDRLLPVMCDKPAAPESLLKVVHCNCQTGCTTKRCTCRGYGLPCTSACGQCQVQSCDNPFNESTDIDTSDDEDSDDIPSD